MKRVILLVMFMILIASMAWGQCPFQRPLGCPNSTINMSGNTVTGDVTYTGTATFTGSDERVKGTDSFVDFNDPTATGSMRLGAYGLTNNEYIDIDFETTADVIDVTSTAYSLRFALTSPNTGNNLAGMKLTTTVPSTAGGTNHSSLWTVTDFEDVNMTLHQAALFDLNYTDTTASTGTGTVIKNTARIRGTGTLTALVGNEVDLVWNSGVSAEDKVITSLSGVKAIMKDAAENANNDLTATTYNGFWSTQASTNVGKWQGTTWRHFYADEDATFKATNFTSLTSLIGLEINDMSLGTSNYGIILADGADCVWMDGTGGTAQCSETITLSNANLKAMAAPVALVSSRGAGVVIEFVSAMLYLDYVDGTALAEPSAPDDMRIEYSGGTDITNDIDATSFIDQTNDEARLVLPDITILPMTTDMVALANQGLQIINTGGDYTGNDTNNTTMDVKITYRVHVL